ncbi:MAG: substrate-binding domain-containing protein [Gaiellaceae bacterium MAG52_C11]|nr:substrate-binding domain-containing protein [Candidatus Gaiellasilicea maunaloa]
MRDLLYLPPRWTLPTQAIGLLVPDLVNPIFPLLAQAIEENARKAGFATILCNTASSPKLEVDYFRALRERRVAGMMFLCSDVLDRAQYTRFLDDGVRLVFVNSDSEGLDATLIGIDERAAGRVASEHLLELGHTSIGLATGSQNSMATRLKRDGAQRALQLAGLDPTGWIAYESFTFEGGRRALRALQETMERSPTGVICANDLIAIGVMAEAAEQGLRVPGDLSVVGFDGTLAASYCSPPLTTIEQPVADLAESAVKALVTLVAESRRSLPSLIFQPRLRVGGSTGPPPGDPGDPSGDAA